MRTLLSLLAVPVIALAQDSPTPIPNAPSAENSAFIKLIEFGRGIDVVALDWNERCGDKKPLDAGCLEVQARLNAAMRAYIAMAKSYRPESQDCLINLGKGLVDRRADLYQWNLDCAGRQELPAQCADRSNQLKKSGEKLKLELDQCINKSRTI